GASPTEAYRLAGVYVTRILKGEKLAIFPLSCPPNMSWSSILKALGLDVPAGPDRSRRRSDPMKSPMSSIGI
ncbi:MAG: hypothetical protein WCF50_17990, partial [Pseudolabrys sp.]